MNTEPFRESAAATHVGWVRENNEDAHAVGDRFWAVADGLGGHVGGEVASRLAVDAVRDYLGVDEHRAGIEQPEVRAAFKSAQKAIATEARAHPQLDDMGTTLVVAVLNPHGTLIVGNVGDSRAYLLVDGVLDQVTTDDNLAQELVDEGELTLEEARTHPGQFQLSKALGMGQRTAPKATVRWVENARGRLLLCTDGLNGELGDPVIAELLAHGAPREAADDLVEAALDHGGSDNVTVIVVDL